MKGFKFDLFAVLVVFLCLAWISCTAELVNAACNTQGCLQECKLHNRWCRNFEGTWAGYRPVGGPTVKFDWGDGCCVQIPDDKDAAELDTFSVYVWNQCTPDCAADNICTGAPPTGTSSETVTYKKNTKCYRKGTE